MRKIFTLIAAAFVAFATMAGELTVFNGTDQNAYIPFRATYFDWTPYYGEVIYPAAEITDLVGKDITTVKFYVANETGNVMNGGELSLYLGTTTQTDFSGWDITLIPASELTLVSATPMTRGDSEIVFNLNEPFTYNGDNLVLMLSVTEVGSYATDGFFFGKNASVNCSAYGASAVYAQQFYPKTTFTYVGEEPQANFATTLDEANQLADNTEFTFKGDAVVTVNKSGYLFLRDESGFAMISGVAGAFENGQVLSQGWSATKTSNNDWVTYTDAANLNASGETNADLAEAIVLNAFPEDDMINAFVCVENQQPSSGPMSFPARSYKLPDGTSISRTEILWGVDGDAGNKPYNVYGVICKVDGVLKLDPTGFAEYVAPSNWKVGDVNHDNVVDVSDVTALIAYVLGEEPEIFFLTEAEVDGDTARVDVGDVTALIAIVLAQAN